MHRLIAGNLRDVTLSWNVPSQHRIKRVRLRAELPPGAVETLAAGFGKLLHGPFLVGSRELHK